MKQGLSGFCVEIDSENPNLIKKWTRGKESAPKLYDSICRQENGLSHFSTIKPVPFKSIVYKDDYCEATMPKYKDIEYYFSDRDENLLIQGILNNMTGEILKIGDLEIPKGNYHGDLAIKNILEKDGFWYLIGYVKRDIETPLNDVVSFFMANKLADDHLYFRFKLCSEIFYAFRKFEDAILFLMKRRLSQYIGRTKNEDTYIKYQNAYDSLHGYGFNPLDVFRNVHDYNK